MTEKRSLESLVADGLSSLWKKNQDLQAEVDRLKEIAEIQHEALTRIGNFIELAEARREAELKKRAK